jgi:hypothetical protein
MGLNCILYRCRWIWSPASWDHSGLCRLADNLGRPADVCARSALEMAVDLWRVAQNNLVTGFAGGPMLGWCLLHHGLGIGFNPDWHGLGNAGNEPPIRSVGLNLHPQGRL